jgi:peroxiredoxin Q/BCP
MTGLEILQRRPVKTVRILTATAAAVSLGLFNLAFGRGPRIPVELRPGDVAPDFALCGSDGVTYRLSDSIGREAVVIAWFPKAFTSHCTIECESLARQSTDLARAGVKCFGASTDAVETNRRFAREIGLGCRILSDPRGIVARAYGVLGAFGLPRRWTFYVGRDGRIAAIDKHVRAASHGEDVVAQLARL